MSETLSTFTPNHRCANPDCRMEFQKPRAVDYNPMPPQVDDILLCGFCGSVSIVTLEATRLMTSGEFDKLQDREKLTYFLLYGQSNVTLEPTDEIHNLYYLVTISYCRFCHRLYLSGV